MIAVPGTPVAPRRLHAKPRAARCPDVCRADGQLPGAGLHNLETMRFERLFNDRGKREWQQPNVMACGSMQRHDVVASALNLDGRQGAPARARLRLHHDAVGQVIANDRLHPVGEIGEEHARRRFAWRDRAVLRIDGSSSVQSAFTCSQPLSQP